MQSLFYKKQISYFKIRALVLLTTLKKILATLDQLVKQKMIIITRLSIKHQAMPALRIKPAVNIMWHYTQC